MPLATPYVACPLRPHIPVELAALTERSRKRLTDADKKISAQLLADAYCDIVDQCLTVLLREVNDIHPSQSMKEALHVTGEIKEKIHHYLGWLVSFFSNDRLIPVIAHFNELVHEVDINGEKKFCCAFSIDSTIARHGKRILTELHDGSAQSLSEGVELLIQIIDATQEPMVLRPKQLMKFNFVVDKTLNGVIALVMALFKRMVRKLGPTVPRDVYPKIAAHFDNFLVM
jgi:hypothetical protein